MKELTIRVVGVDEGSPTECFVLGLAEHEDPEEGEHLMLQGELKHADEGQLYCLCTPSGTTYAPVLSWSLTDRVLELRLSDRAAAELGVDGGFRLDLRELSDGDVEMLEKSVARVLARVPRGSAAAGGRDS
ncbi:MAG: hypothetical protein KC492_28250 [Myxococcales bacterium]|nr:hypothetical protein [Myxococcales bacterium]